jgi:hypothetical protein
MTIEPRINACLDPPTLGIFLTCPEGIFSFHMGHTHYTAADSKLGRSDINYCKNKVKKF